MPERCCPRAPRSCVLPPGGGGNRAETPLPHSANHWSPECVSGSPRAPGPHCETCRCRAMVSMPPEERVWSHFITSTVTDLLNSTFPPGALLSFPGPSLSQPAPLTWSRRLVCLPAYICRSHGPRGADRDGVFKALSSLGTAQQR